MNPLSHFLSKFKNLTPPHGALKKTVIRTLADIANVSVTPADISFSNGIAFIRCSSVAKNAIRISRGRILQEIFHTHAKARDTIRDIR